MEHVVRLDVLDVASVDIRWIKKIESSSESPNRSCEQRNGFSVRHIRILKNMYRILEKIAFIYPLLPGNGIQM